MLQLGRTSPRLLCASVLHSQAGKADWEQKPVSQSVYVGERQSWDAACSEGVKGKKRVKSFELPLGVGGIHLRAVFMFVVEVGESPVPLFLVK